MKNLLLTLCLIGGALKANAQERDVYYSNPSAGYGSWDVVSNWSIYAASGGGKLTRLPGEDEYVKVNANTLAVENGRALSVTSGVDAVCHSFASGQNAFEGKTTWFRLDGGNLTCMNNFIIGQNYAGLATLESGTVGANGHFLIGSAAGGDGTVTNNGADITCQHLIMGYVSGTAGRMTHNGGTLNARGTLQVGRAGGIGAFDVNAPFTTRNMVIGTRVGAPGVNGTGTVTVAAGFTNLVKGYLKVNNGELVMRGSTLQFKVNAVTNALINRDSEDGVGVIRGWGSLEKRPDGDRNPWVENSGLFIADGEGETRDLSLYTFVAVTNTFYNGPAGTNGWYAVNKGRLRYPRTYTTGAAVTQSACYGDWRTLTTPSLVNSLKLEVTLSSSGSFYVYGELYAPDRSDIPAGLPTGTKTVGIWRMRITSSESPDGTPKAFVSVLPTFRYDHTQVKVHESLGLYRYNGSAWVKVGSGTPDGTSLISASAPLPPVNGEVGWFAVLTQPRGTLISVH